MDARNLQSAWIAPACAEVRRLHEAGDSDGAALLAADVERYALGLPLRSCSACDEPAMLARPWCEGCRPPFIQRPDAQPLWTAWLRVEGQVGGRGRPRRVSAAQVEEMVRRRDQGERVRDFSAEYRISANRAWELIREWRRMSGEAA